MTEEQFDALMAKLDEINTSITSTESTYLIQISEDLESLKKSVEEILAHLKGEN